MLRSVFLLLIAAGVARAAPPDVLIVYDSGRVLKTLTEADPDSVTAGPTPKVFNCRIIAEQLTAALEARHVSVRAAQVSEIKDYRELLGPKLIVFGTPTRFWNVSWEMKKLLDEQVGKIYVSSQAEFAKKRFAAFAMAEIEPCARAALDAVKSAVQDCGGKLDNTLVVLVDSDKSDARRDVVDFADKLASPLP